MKVFKVSIKFEQNGGWSNRDADAEGYLVKPNAEDDVVEGYVKILYPTCFDPVKYVKGLYSNGSLVFMQLCNEVYLSPICYCFPNIQKNGFWSVLNYRLGFFPLRDSISCSNGHATVILEEITDVTRIKKIEQETSAIFAEKSSNATKINQDLMKEVRDLANLLNEKHISQMELHCGKW